MFDNNAMSGLLNSSANGSTSNLPDSAGRPFATSLSSQPATAQGFHHSGGMQGLHGIHGNFNIPNMPGSLPSRNPTMSGAPSSGVQQLGGSISNGRFASNNLQVGISQLSHGSSHGHSGVTNRGGVSIVGNPGFSNTMSGVGGSVPVISSSSASLGNRNSISGFGTTPILGNVGPRITSSMGNIIGGNNIGRSISSGGLSDSGLASRINLAANSGSMSPNLQGANRLMSSMLHQQGPQMMSMLGNSYPSSGGLLSQRQLQSGNNPLSSMGMLNDMNFSDNSPFDMNDFPQLTGRPNSAGGPQGQLGSLRKQGGGVSSIVQQSQEFSIQNEDFPALPGFKGGSSDFSMDMHQKEQIHENASMLQSQHFPMGRSSGFSLGGAYPSTRQQQHGTSGSSAGVSFTPGNNLDLLQLHGSDVFPSHHSYHSQIQNSGLQGNGLRPLNSPTPASGTYEHLLQQYQFPPSSHSQMRLQQLSAMSQSYRDQSLKSLQGTQTPPDRFGIMGLLSVTKGTDPDLTSLAMGIDLTTLGLNLNSADNLHRTFGSPWSDEPAKGEPEYSIPTCYYATQPTPPLQQGHFAKFQTPTLFYIFYSMPKDEAQLYAANELYSRGWFYHKEAQLWFTRVANVEPLVKTSAYERGSYIVFDTNTWDIVRKDNFVVMYEAVEKRPTLPSASLSFS